MAPVAGTFSLVSIGDLVPVVEDKLLGDVALDLTLASGQVKGTAPVGGAVPLDFTFQIGSACTVVALNGATGTDEMGVVAGVDAKTPAGEFAPPLGFDGTHGWLKYVATALARADVNASGGIASLAGRAGQQIETADYHRHALSEGLRHAIPADLGALRSALVLNHVQTLPEGDAVAFQTVGELSASLDIAWSDLFTSEINGLARLLEAAAPIAIHVTAGATCSVKVAVTDTFIVVFARAVGGKLVAAIRKGHVRTVDASAGATISVSLADANAVEAILNDVVAGLLGTVAARIQTLLDHLAAGAMTPDDHSLAAVIVDRLKLAGVAQIDKAIDALKAKARDGIAAVVKSKIEASFAYEYHRVGSDVSVFHAEIPDGGPSQALHKELVRGNLAAAFGRGPGEISVKKFLNERSTTLTQAWGFTLGLHKWKVFGLDRREVESVERVDVTAGTMQRSYLGTGGYSRNKLSWTIDFAADMTTGARSPLVGDYRFGLHVAMLREPQTFTAADLDTALDFAALWSICPEGSLPFVRQQLAGAVDQQAEWSFHLRVNDEALRPIFRVLGSMTPRDFAGAAAAALDATGVPSVIERRRTYEGLWRAVLDSAGAFTTDTVRARASLLLKNANLARKERDALEHHFFDQSTVATIVGFDPGWFLDCQTFSQGCRLLADAVATPTADRGTIPEVYRRLVPFWTQSHYVRTLGAALVDVARLVGQFNGIERTLNLESGSTTIVMSSNQS